MSQLKCRPRFRPANALCGRIRDADWAIGRAPTKRSRILSAEKRVIPCVDLQRLPPLQPKGQFRVPREAVQAWQLKTGWLQNPEVISVIRPRLYLISNRIPPLIDVVSKSTVEPAPSGLRVTS
jgi:hypothetical protein